MNEMFKIFSFGVGVGVVFVITYFVSRLFKTKRPGTNTALGNAIEEAGNLVQSAGGTATELGNAVEESIGTCQNAQQSNSELADSIATSWGILQELKKRKAEK